jgi:enamine deaminase RidA (YjgF/YER057c/UK114 family)
MEAQSRRSLLKNAAKMAAAAATVTAGTAAITKSASAQGGKPVKMGHPAPGAPQTVPGTSTLPYSPAISYGNLLFLSGIGSHIKGGTVEQQTDAVLNDIKAQLESCGSSMDKVLKVNVYLSDAKNWGKMNSIYSGRFGKVPPTRTTIAGALVGDDALIEIECIAYV